MIGLDESNAGGVVLAFDNGGVVAGGEGLEGGGLMVVGGGNAGGLDFALLGVFPVVVGGDSSALDVMQFQHRVLEPKAGEVIRANTARMFEGFITVLLDLLGLASDNDWG